MTLKLPESLEASLTPQEAALALAIGLYVTSEVNLDQASAIAGTTAADFLQKLGTRHFPIHYGRDELEEDLRTTSCCAR